MKTLNFTVSVTFTDKVTDDETILDIARNIARAIKSEADNGMGISPDYADMCTKSVSVKPEFLSETISENIY